MDQIDQDRLTPSPKQSNQWFPLFIVLTLAILFSAGAYYIYQQRLSDIAKIVQPLSEPTSPNSLASELQAPTEKLDVITVIPQQQQNIEQNIEQSPPLPTLADSDDYLREHWPEWALPDKTKAWFQGEFIVQRAVSFIDGLANGAILSKLSPLNKSPLLRPKTKFQATSRNGDLWLDQTNFSRYKLFTEFLLTIEPEALARLFHQLRPLLESAYGQLGKPADQFGNQLLKGLDLLLETPHIDAPIRLKRESVYYQFADPALEALTDTQKLLLRMGPDNRKLIKQWGKSFKDALLETH